MYLSLCDSTVFCFPKAEDRAIYFSNCWCDLTIYNRIPSEKDKKRIINHVLNCQGKRYFWFEAFKWLVLCCRRTWSWRSLIGPKGTAKEISKNLLVRNLQIFTSQVKSFFQLVVTLCELQFKKESIKVWKIPTYGRYQISRKTWYFRTSMEPCFQAAEMNKNF